MDKYKKFIVWISLFLVVSCSNLSNLCRHPVSSSKAFNYEENNDTWFEQAALYTSSVESLANFPPDAAQKLEWETLRDVIFELRYNEEMKIDIHYPKFGSSVKKLSGKVMYITGYLIPLNPDAGLYAVSRYNYASCFFCGRAGPESVISLKFKTTPRRYKTDEYLTMKGKLELNDTNIRDFIYIFRDTQEFKAP